MIGKGLHRGLEREDVAAIIEAHDWIAGLADRSCDCGCCESTQIDNPCDSCQARRALDALAKVIDPRPITLQPSRLKNEAERIYYELWCKQNERLSYLNGGFTLIEHLLHPEGSNRSRGSDPRPAPVTQHDMTIATTVIQWLGTNCGRGFVVAAEQEIEKRRAQRAELGTNGLWTTPAAWKDREGLGRLYCLADSIAGHFISVEKNRSAYEALRTAIHNALCEIERLRDGGDRVQEQENARGR